MVAREPRHQAVRAIGRHGHVQRRAATRRHCALDRRHVAVIAGDEEPVVETRRALVRRERAGRRSEPDRIEREQHDFFERVRTCYLDIARRETDRVAVVDTTRPIDAVTADVIGLIDKLLEKNSS